MIRIKGVAGGKVHIANPRCCDAFGAVAICATRLRGDFSTPATVTDEPVTCAWCAEHTHLLLQKAVAA